MKSAEFHNPTYLMQDVLGIDEVCECPHADICVHGSLRLVGGTTPFEGRLEVCYFNQWGTVCDDGWSTNDARVACGQMGYSTTSKLHGYQDTAFCVVTAIAS